MTLEKEKEYMETENYKDSRRMAFLADFRKIPYQIEELENKIKKLKEERENILKEYPDLLTN